VTQTILSRWDLLSPLLDELLDADESERGKQLERLRHDNPTLARDLARMLGLEAEIDRVAFLERHASTATHSTEPGALAGSTIGPYTLDRLLGAGGMGSVWLAHRSDGRFEGKAAIKFLDLALLGRGGAERFQREGSVLARLAHPNIARWLDAGVANAGQPYLVLEYVDGIPIDKWCQSCAFDLRARLRLFLDVLAAVAHAHKNLILHRDLKPANILVTSEGQVKLLDFGIAKLLENQAQASAATELTQQSGHAYTRGYAAPEQIGNGAMTTATDVYSLGVILFELLTGTRPYKLKRPSAAALEEAIAEQEPPLGSTVAVRQEFRRQLRGDLDAILNQALKKRPEQRYAAVSEVRAEIERYLDGLPVQAQPQRLGYRFAKFVLRNRVVVGACVAVLIAVLAGSAISIWQTHQGSQKRDRALALSARNQSVTDFVSTILTEIAPPEQPIRVADLLERSMVMLSAGGSNPEHEAAILGMLADYFLSAGDNPVRAKELLEKSLDLTRSTEDPALRSVLLCDHADATLALGQPREAIAEVEEGLRLARDDAVAASRCWEVRATIARVSGRPKEAMDAALQSLARLQASPIAMPAAEASALDTIAAAHSAQGNGDEADRFFAATLAKLAQAGRSESPRAGVIHNNRGVASYAAGDFQQALANYDEALRISQRWSIGQQTPASVLSNRAKALRELARYAEALEGFDLAVASAQQSGRADMRVDALVNRAATYLAMGNLAKAEQAMAQARAEPDVAINPNSATGISLTAVQARIAAARGDLSAAASSLSALIDSFDRRKFVSGTVTSVLRSRCDVYLRQGNAEAAMADAQRALQMARALQGSKAHSSLTGLALLSVSQVHLHQGADSEARLAAAQALSHLSVVLGNGHPDTQLAQRAAM